MIDIVMVQVASDMLVMSGNKGTLVVAYASNCEAWSSGPMISCLVSSPDPPHPLCRDETSSHLHLSCRSICYWITM